MSAVIRKMADLKEEILSKNWSKTEAKLEFLNKLKYR